MTDAPRIALMQASLQEVRAGLVTSPVPSDLPPPPPPPPAPEPMTEAQLYAQFRADMRRSGLMPIDINEEMLGIPYTGPVVNVRDPAQATAATSLTLATHALAPNLWRIYPVLSPISL